MKSTHIALVAILASGMALSAQEIKFGFQAGIASPMGDLKTAVDSKTGFSVGANMLIDMGSGFAIVPRLDMTQFKSDIDGCDLKFTTTAVIVDFNYFVSGKANNGFFLLAGLGYSSNKSEVFYRV